MDAIGSDELGRAKIDYDKCVSCGMCLVNCPFAAIADKSQILQVITAMPVSYTQLDVYKRQASRIEGEYQLLPFVGEDVRKLKKNRC